MKTSSRNCTNR